MLLPRLNLTNLKIRLRERLIQVFLQGSILRSPSGARVQFVFDVKGLGVESK